MVPTCEDELMFSLLVGCKIFCTEGAEQPTKTLVICQNCL